MKRPTLSEGIALALAVSIVGGVMYSALATYLPVGPALRFLMAATSLAYVVYLLSRSPERVGRITALAVWMVVAGVLWLAAPSITLYALVHVGMIWLLRSLYFHSSLLSALADLGLNALSLAAVLWAALQSGNIFLTLWCFFLVQALFVAIPPRVGRKGKETLVDVQDSFDRAYRAAEHAVRDLSSIT